MKSPSLLRILVLGVASLVAAPLALSQTAIAEFSESSIDFYEAPQLSAKSQKIAVPSGKPGPDWQVLDSKNRFYQIQAGSHGTGWALRSKIILDPSSPIVLPPCSRQVASSPASRQATGGVAGATGAGGC